MSYACLTPARTGATTKASKQISNSNLGQAIANNDQADLAICRNPRYKLGPQFIYEYLKRVPASEPAEDFDARNAVYAMKYHTLLSILYVKYLRFRQILKDELHALLNNMGEPPQVVGRDAHL
jgi:hypothetical protein